MQVDQHLLLRIGYALLVTFGKDCFRSDAVHPNAVGPNLAARSDEDFYARLGGGVKRLAIRSVFCRPLLMRW